MKQNVKWLQLIIIIILSTILWNLNPPEGLNTAAWHSLIIFIATIISIVTNILPIGAVGFISITVYIITNAGESEKPIESIKTGLSEFNNSLIWLIVVAFLIARGFIKTGLGKRIALIMIKILGKKTLGLAYGLAIADLILAPAMPSNTARCGGVIYPIADSLSRSFNSKPENESRKKIGTFLITCIGNINDITSALFMTAFTGNLLTVKLAKDVGVEITWNSWFLAALLPCLIAFIIIPLVIYFITAKPEITSTPDAPQLAKKQLIEMGKMTLQEWIMIGTVIILLVLWIFGTQLRVDPTTAAFIGLSILLLTSVLSWKDVIGETGAWDTLIWFSALLMMATQLKTLGFMTWFGETVGDKINHLIGGSNWIIILILLNAIYMYTHYFFASGNAQIVALFSVFVTMGIQLKVPVVPLVLMLGFTSNLYCSLTQYTHARGPILFGAGYVPTKTWWKSGFISSVINQIIFLSAGLLWWKILGLY